MADEAARNRIPPTLKVAETLENRAARFQNWNGAYGYYGHPPVSLSAFMTDVHRSMQYNMSDFRSNAEVCRTMREANKNAVVKQDKPLVKSDPRPIVLTRSVSHESFVNSLSKGAEARDLGVTRQLQQTGELLAWERAFNEVAALNQSRVGAQDDTFITMKQVDKVVIAVLGQDVPRFVMEKFMILSKKAEAGGRVYWEDFKRLAPRAVQAATADCSLKKELPPLVMLMTKPRMVDPGLGPMGSLKSVYKDSYCVDHQELLKEYAESNGHRSVLNPAAKTLASGTVRGTLQLPGLSLHMPMNTRIPLKVRHSDGSIQHPVINDLRMTKKGGNNVLGYAGHVPWHAESDGERMSGCDPRTSTGAAYGHTRLML
jgi:hypothetical protein